MKLLLPVLLLGLVSIPVHSAPVKKGELYTTGVTEQGDSSVNRPRNSQTKEAVMAEFGEPENKIDAVGEPPISSWQYEKFEVFFEDDLVIHSVLKK